MNSVSEDIKDMLVAESSLGLTFAKDMFIGNTPAKPDNCVTVIDSFGFGPQLTLDNKFYDYCAAQIRVRNRDYRTGWSLANDIMISLHGRAQETWNGTLYSVIYCSGGPVLEEWDDNMRAKFIINFNVQRR
jgi:hypothetical protein